MEIKINYRKYLKSNPEVILEKMPREMLKKRAYRITYLRSQGLTYQEIADVYGCSRQNIESTLNRVVVKYMKYRNMDTSNVGNYR